MQITAARRTAPDNNQSMTTLTTVLAHACAGSSEEKAESNSGSYLPQSTLLMEMQCARADPETLWPFPPTEEDCCMLQQHQFRVFN